MSMDITGPFAGTDLELNGIESDVVNRHKERIKSLARTLATMARESPEWIRSFPLGGHRYPPPRFKQPRTATTFAVLGPRGSGKSTCMVRLIRELSLDADARKVNVGGREFRCLFNFLIIDQTVDFTLGPREVPLGLSALMRLRRVLELDRDEPVSWSCEGEDRAHPAEKDEKRAFKAMREAYMLNRLAAGRVLEGTSSSGSHFAQQSSGAAADALALPDRVADWLQQAVIRSGEDVEGFILILDDIDLARDGLRGFVHSLLDELHQPRLILVLGANLPRLERRIARSAEEDQRGVDSADPTELQVARDLLYKGLPQHNREWLRPWPTSDRRTFPPGDEVPFPDPRKLKDLLLARRSDWGVASRNPSLLPGYPRSLENIWFALLGLQDGRPMLDKVEDYLAYIAEARGEHELARRISSRPVSEWARLLSWPEDPISDTEWEDMVTSALEGGPLRGLTAKSDTLPIPQENRSDSALWIEVLLDLALEARHRATSRAHLTAVELIRRFPRMRTLLDQAQIDTDFHREDMAKDFTKVRGSVLAQLSWTRFDVSLVLGDLPEEFRAQIGLAPLQEAAEGRRNVWPTHLLQGLYLQRSEVLNERQRSAYGTDSKPEDATDLLPCAVRPLVVFLDALSRAPWGLLSETPRRRTLRINTLFAAGLVRTAYVDALDRIVESLARRGHVEESVKRTISDVEDPWLNTVRDRGQTPIVEWTDESIEEHFQGLLREGNPCRKLTAEDLVDPEGEKDSELVFAPYNELVRCLENYTKSRAFRHLAEESESSDVPT